METTKVSIRDVAKRAGVSLGTVSNVLNRPEQVSPRSRERVLKAMKQMNYIPSRAASQLRSQRSALVGVAVPDVGNLYWASVVRGIEHVCDEKSMGMIVSSIHQDADRQQRVFTDLMRQGVDGLIIAPVNVLSEDLLEFHSRLGIVSIGESPIVPYVACDAQEGMQRAAEHLLELGHRHIGLINGDDHVSWCAARRSGVIQAMSEQGLSISRYLHEYVVDDLTVQMGRQGTRHVLESHPEVTALVCANDTLALGALLEVKSKGIRIPNDISIVGYDDVEFSAVLSPPLTTVRQVSYELGVHAARLLFAQEQEQEHEFEQPLLPMPQLIIRDSTGPVPLRCAGE